MIITKCQFRPRLNMLSATVACCIALAACGGGDGPVASQESAQSAAASQETARTSKVMTLNSAKRPAPPAATPPIIVITSQGKVDDAGLVSFAGYATDKTGVAHVKWVNSLGGGGTADLAGTGKMARWSVQAVQLQSGSNSLTFTAQDNSGSMNSTQAVVRYEPASNGTKVTLLPALPIPSAWNQVSGIAAPTWDGISPLRDPATGTPLLEQAMDPNGSGRTVHVRRILKSGPLLAGAIRAESAWASGAYGLVPGADYWMAFGLMIKVDEAIPSTDEGLLVFQTHTQASGSTNPDISLIIRGTKNQMTWNVAYNTHPSDTWRAYGGPNPDTENFSVVSTQTMPVPGIWTKFIIHYRPGYVVSQNPLFEVWKASPGEAYSKLFSHTGPNTYNSLPGPSYPRIGPYRWNGAAWATDSMAFYQTPLFFGQGANLFDAAAGALTGL